MCEILLITSETKERIELVPIIFYIIFAFCLCNNLVEIRTNDNMTLIAEEDIGSLQPLSWKKIEFEYTAITSVPRTVWVRIDPQNSISETNESDNLASGSSE